MKKLVLIGGGGHCKSVLDAALRMKLFQKIVILDPGITEGNKILECSVVGDDEKLNELLKMGFDNAFITVGSIGNTKLRKKLFRKASELGFSFPNIIDPSAVVSKYAILGNGIYIGKNVTVNADVRIDDHAIINTSSIVEHDCQIGKFVHIAVGAVVCGNCIIEDDAFVGANATIIQGITISNGRFIKAGEIISK